MKLFRFGEKGRETPGVILKDEKLNISPFGEDFDEIFFGSEGILRLKEWLASHYKECELVGDDTRLGPPIARPSKIICVGLNYASHAKESGMEIPSEPVLFFKSTTAIAGPNDDLVIPKGSKKTDWEVELAIVIGKRAGYVPKTEALDYIAGYMLHNDYSERTFQLEQGGQWVKGKSADTFAPIGPYLVTKDEIPDPGSLDLWLAVNGREMQRSNTSDMVFDVPHLVSYISQFMTLLPGDIISTGTPFGVGLGMEPPQYLNHGDVVELGVDGLGTSMQHVKTYESTLNK
jgi:2-keto-4-pentenoate hydratase/2-oxohepta-3-ene-1,7-dioic acid hydratase in catechol pathway